MNNQWFSKIAVWLVIAMVLFTVFKQFDTRAGASAGHVGYSEFLEEVRGSRIKNIVEELNGERIDIVRWNDSLQVLIRYALQPAQILDVHCYPRLGRAIVLVDDENLSLAIGKKGQNVRLATKLVGWDIEIMTDEELQKSLNKAELWFRQIPGITDELIEAFITEGCFSYEDITVLKAEDIATLSGNVLTEEEADDILEYAEQYAEMMETATAEEEEQEAQAAEEAQAAAEPIVWGV
mgnify:CR=1 FL=1